MNVDELVIFRADVVRCSKGTFKVNLCILVGKSSHSAVEARRLEAPRESGSPGM